MVSLRELQRAFAEAVLFDHSEHAVALLEGQNTDGIAPAERIGIYRNNCRIGFAATLAAEFPVVQQLGGADWFEQTARQYQQHFPSPSGNLHHIGALFASYLAQELAGTAYEYFADVARLEWAYQEVLVAAESEALDVKQLSQLTADDYASLRFCLRPAVRLVASRYPILKLWQAHQPESESENLPSIDIDSGPQYVLIVRRDTHVELRALPRGEFLMLDAFTHGENLERALLDAAQSDESFDAAAVMPRLVHSGALAGFQTG